MRRTKITALLMLVSLMFCGCMAEVEVPCYLNDECEECDYGTINGFYDVNIFEATNICDYSGDNHHLDFWTFLRVNVQERYEDDSFLVNMSLEDLHWEEADIALSWQNVEVSPPGETHEDSKFDVSIDPFRYTYRRGIYRSNFHGTITPEEIDATIRLDMLHARTHEMTCFETYSVVGYRLYPTAEPPTRFFNR